MEKIAVVVITYNRSEALKRLLKGLDNAFYNSTIDLIISIDKSDIEKKMVNIAEDFKWVHGQKKVRTFKVRQGLKKHVLQCGDYALEYDGVILFEDDIIPSPYYFEYSKQAMSFYQNDYRIAGISLYSPTMNEIVDRPFIPLNRGDDVYFMQSAQSWGQCWTTRMWQDFREWFSLNDGHLIKSDDMPDKINNWPETSWKKYFMKYIVEKNKYFVYPYISLSTNTFEVGQHVRETSTQYQVPLLMGKKNYDFITLDQGVKYDVFFENQMLSDYLELSKEDVCIDLYGQKESNQSSRYILTTKILEFEIVSNYKLSFIPHDLNIIYENTGKDVYLYDLGEETNIQLPIHYINKHEYYVMGNWKDSFKNGVRGLRNSINRRLLR